MVITRSTAKEEIIKEDSDGEYEMATGGNVFNSIDARRPDPLVFDGNINENWRVFKQNFDIYAIAIELEERKESQQVGIFHNTCGSEAIEIFNTFNLTPEQKKKYNVVVQSIQDYCTPKKNEVYEAFRFNSRSQQEGEPFDSYLLEPFDS